MRRVMAVLFATACAGPPATDAEICRDVIHRLCLSRCPDIDPMLGLTATSDCTAQLTANTGCGSDSFKLKNRDGFLSCRLPIIRSGDNVEMTPDCNDVDDMFRGCPELVQFYKTGAQ